MPSSNAAISGAVYFDIDEVADKNTALPHMLPTAAEFGVAVGKLGISERDTTVIYDEGNQFSAPRGWWTFRNFGARHVYVLDEGLNGWAALGGRWRPARRSLSRRRSTPGSTPTRW